jgi:hypothetical protein
LQVKGQESFLPFFLLFHIESTIFRLGNCF